MDTDANDLFNDPFPLEGMFLDIDTLMPQKAITSLLDDFQIRTMSDIRTLKEVVALNYTKGIRLYRGHESCDYKIESTIVRHIKGEKKDCSILDILDAEKKGFNMFCRDVFKEEWFRNKLEQSDETLFKMSIGRHLGLPCRLIDVTASLETAVWFAVADPRHYNEDGEIIITNTMEVIDSLRRTPKELVHTFTWSVDSIRVLKMNYLENDVNFESSKPVGGFQCNIDILYLE